ncbi:MAG: capsular biosynthesis protein [Methylovulum sp.]|uniref:capsule biosynthesis protein n=1 Tax=Methylovulum sp. TaxID=1916980 RepID=UPI002639E515|nr:capsular biosynthesis protein [Methylovulum sp.]MDD2723246.1 capsular biosynthesis protein [Methylovulum sp.]MDD5123433.1 capsular biosynthesis protein [Methylovulum sp.]
MIFIKAQVHRNTVVNTGKRSFLFLQGPCSPLFAKLADHLHSQGHAVHKINFTGGDVAYWTPRKATLFRGELGSLPEVLEAVRKKYAITDQILFGDCRPIHVAAKQYARQHGIRTHVFEEGYFRPYWMTLEREGVNGHSMLPRDPDWYRRIGKYVPSADDKQIFHAPFKVRATHDVIYHVAGLGNRLVFRHYKSHAPDPVALEYAGYVNRFVRLHLTKKQDNENIQHLLRKKIPYYLLPLQLNSDSQIQVHSTFTNMVEVIDLVMRSFAEHAATRSWLVIKTHPLDAGLLNYGKIIEKQARQLGLNGRILFLQSGNLNTLVAHARGLVTVNSTAGGLALELDCPTVTLNNPIYNLSGLTFQGGLNAFWCNSEKPDQELFRCFRNTVIHTTQVNGSLYSKPGIDLAVKNASRFFDTDKSPLETFL